MEVMSLEDTLDEAGSEEELGSSEVLSEEPLEEADGKVLQEARPRAEMMSNHLSFFMVNFPFCAQCALKTC